MDENLCEKCVYYFDMNYIETGGITKCLVIKEEILHKVHTCTYFREKDKSNEADN